MFKKYLLLACTLMYVSPVLSADFNAGYEAYQNENYSVALENFKPLAEQGNKVAQYNLGLMYRLGQGVPTDYEQAVYWFRKSAEQENANAQYSLAFRYYRGQGVPQDYEQAVYWFTKSAKQGNSYAQYSLAFRYYKGQGVPQDYVLAYVWFDMGTMNGNTDAIKGKDLVLKNMTPTQIKDAQEISRECYNSNYKNCTY